MAVQYSQAIDEKDESRPPSKSWQRSLGIVGLVCLTLSLALVVCGSLVSGPSKSSVKPSELLVGGGFLGDLPTGGEHGNDKVRAMKDLVHHAANEKQLQEALSKQMGMSGSESVSQKKAAAIAAAAAAIAKILAVPSARSIVLGHAKAAASTHDAETSDDSSSNSSNDDSDGKSIGQKLTPWLKTPKDEGRFSYHHQKLARTFSSCSKRTDYECNEIDPASQVINHFMASQPPYAHTHAPPASTSNVDFAVPQCNH
jgi:hypothetical protein